MQRVEINPPKKILFSHTFTIVKEDINEADHLGNERILVFANSIRNLMSKHLKLNLLDMEKKIGIIVANHSVNYKSEGFLGDVINCHVGIENISECSFDMIFQFVKENGRNLAFVRSGCIYFDFMDRKINPLPEQLLLQIS